MMPLYFKYYHATTDSPCNPWEDKARFRQLSSQIANGGQQSVLGLVCVSPEGVGPWSWWWWDGVWQGLVWLEGGTGQEHNDEMLAHRCLIRILCPNVNCRVSFRVKLVLKLIVTLEHDGHFIIDVHLLTEYQKYHHIKYEISSMPQYWAPKILCCLQQVNITIHKTFMW